MRKSKYIRLGENKLIKAEKQKQLEVVRSEDKWVACYDEEFEQIKKLYRFFKVDGYFYDEKGAQLAAKESISVLNNKPVRYIYYHWLHKEVVRTGSKCLLDFLLRHHEQCEPIMKDYNAELNRRKRSLGHKCENLNFMVENDKDIDKSKHIFE